MTDPRDLISAATPLPWSPWTNGFDAGIVSDSDGGPANDRYRPLIVGGEPHEGWIDPYGDDVALIVYAVNNLPALLDVADALELLTTFVDESAPSDFRWAARHALSGAQEALARLRENQP